MLQLKCLQNIFELRIVAQEGLDRVVICIKRRKAREIFYIRILDWSDSESICSRAPNPQLSP